MQYFPLPLSFRSDKERIGEGISCPKWSVWDYFCFGETETCKLLEEGEVDTAVLSVLDETGVLAEVVVLAVLYDQEAILAEEATLQNHVGQFGYLGQHIGRVGKDEVKLLPALTEVLEHVALDWYGIEVLKLVYKPLDEFEVQRVFFHAYHTGASTGKQFQRYASGTGKEVQGHGFLLPVDIGVEDVEKVLLGKVCSGTCLECAGNVEMTALVFTGYYAHSR